MSEIYHKNISEVKNLLKRQNRGFTLIELLVVVLIIGILAAVALPQYKKAVIRARIARVLPQLKAIQDAQERFYMANGHYTTDKADLDIYWDREGPEASSRFTLKTNNVTYHESGIPWILRCYQFANVQQDSSCPEVARGKFVCNGYGSDMYAQICRSFSQDQIYPWTSHATYW